MDRVTGTPNAEVPANLIDPSDLDMVAKRQMDSFHETDLDTLLNRAFQAESILITGINTDTCVHATTFGASHRGYVPVVVSDCVGSMRGPDHHWMALELMSRTMAWVVSLEDVIQELKAESH